MPLPWNTVEPWNHLEHENDNEETLSGPEFTTQYFIYYVRKYLCG